MSYGRYLAKVPVTYTMMWVGSLALAGFPFFAGFYSKDMILEAAYGALQAVCWLSGWDVRQRF